MSNSFIKMTDAVGLDMHFIRFFHLALFDSRPTPLTIDMDIIKDTLMIIVIIVPLFIIGLRFWTAPAYLAYTLQINSYIAPLTLPVMFCCSHFDVLFLGLLVLIMNIYVFWYHVDPPVLYQAGNQYSKYTTRKPVGRDYDN